MYCLEALMAIMGFKDEKDPNPSTISPHWNLRAYTDRNNFEDSYHLVKDLLVFMLWEYRTASFYLKEAILYSQSVKSGKCFTN